MRLLFLAPAARRLLWRTRGPGRRGRDLPGARAARGRLRAEGLRIRSPLGDAVVHPKLVTSQTLDGAYDVVVLSCKAYDLASAIEAIRPAVGRTRRCCPS